MKLAYDDLERLHASLFEQLLSGTLEVDDYFHEWDRLVSFAGWTWDEVATEIDLQWSQLRHVPQPAFLC